MTKIAAMEEGQDLAVRVKGLTVAFGAFHAIDDVDLEVGGNHLHFLIGPNGAGKTTLIDAITGLVPYTGTISVGGRALARMTVQDIARFGVGRTFQTATVFERQTVVQNLDIALRGGRHWASLLTQIGRAHV